jgi:arginase family enzyme
MTFEPLHTIIDFLEPLNVAALFNDISFKETQAGKNIDVYENHFPDIKNADIILIGCAETRGGGGLANTTEASDAIRKQFYNLYNWHPEIQIADVGNVKTGASLEDSYAALKAVLSELVQANKKVVILGGSHDNTLAQYETYTCVGKIIEVACIDALIDLNMDSSLPADNFLMSMFTSQPNFVKHYNHIGFQSYLVHPAMLETIDKLGFDCYRAGKVKENISEMEPVLRNSDFLSFDISAIQHSHAPANYITPNGFTGEEACALMQYAGMSKQISSIGIYGYLPHQDVNFLTAKQISHMLWYLVDGMVKGRLEAGLDDKQNFNEFHLSFTNMETLFLQSKKTGRWWMQLPEGNYISCSYNDYVVASNNEIPERWLRAVERSS